VAALASVFVEVKPTTDRFEPELRRKLARVDGSRAGVSIGKSLGGGMRVGVFQAIPGIAKGLVGAFAAIKVGGFLKGAISEASDLGETVSKTQQIFGKSSASVVAFGKTAATSLGQIGRASCRERV